MSHKAVGERAFVLGESFTLPLEQVVASLSSLELCFHQAKRLPCGKDGLAILAIRLAINVDLGKCSKANALRPQTCLQLARQAANDRE